MELSDNARAVLKRRYFKKDQMGDIIEDEKAMLSRVSDNIAGGNKEKAKRYFSLMDNCYFLPNSPTLMNAGNDLQQLSACFVLPIEDSMESIFTAVKNSALIHKSGGGTGFSFSKLREHNARVRSTSGVSSGPITFMKVFNSATDAVKQGGCLVQDTLIYTDEGTKYLSDICDTKQIGWKDHNLKVPTHEGLKISKQSYNNGIVKTIKIITENGFELCGTPEHKVKVFAEKGLVWKKICDLGRGDKLYVKLGQHIGQNADLFTDIELTHPNQNECKLPKNLTLDFAFWLGLLCGDGFVANNESDYRIGISINKDSYLVDYIEQLTRELFDVSLTQYKKKNDNSITFVVNNKKLKTFLINNGFNKTDSRVCSIPKKLLQSKKEIIGSFLKGLFEADGTITHNYPSLSTTSKKLAHEVAVLLRGLGIPCKKRIIESSPDRFGDSPLFVVTVYSYIGLKRYLEFLGFNEKSRFSDLTLEKIDLAREKSFPLFNFKEIISSVLDKITLPQTDERNRGEGKNYTSNFPELRKSLLRYLRGERIFSASSYLYYSEKYEEFNKNAPQIDFLDYYDEVVSVEDGGEKLTLDISVEDNHTYIANGFVTHNTRRGANMAILNIDHPDIIDFIKAKEKNTELNNFNLSVGLTEAFMDAVKNNDEYELIAPHSGKVKKRYKAQDVFELIVEMAHKNGEPGMVFLDRLERYNPTPKDGKIEATNPCGEQPLLANEACNLGSINLVMMRKNGAINWDLLKETVYTATDFLDDVIDRSAFPLPEIEKQAKKNRKIGLGIMGWSDLLLQLGIPYCSDEAVDVGREIMEFIDYYSKERSMQLAVEKGSFPNFKQSIYNKGTLIREGYKLNWDGLIAEIQKKGIRNATTTTIAPTGTISMIADASSGVEPIFSLVYIKNVMDGEKLLYVNKYFEEIAREQKFYSKELMEKISEKGSLQDIDEIPDEVKRIFVTAHDITPEWHIRMQAAFQEFVDNAVSKTINFPNYATKEDIYTSYMLAYQLGCKGVTVYRDGSRDEQVLHVGKKMREHDKTRIEPRHRPETTIGVTKKINTGCGHLYVTINIDETGPFEVFTQMGKVGGCASAQLEAIARLISLALRSNVKVESIVKQLRLIRCPSPMWSKGKKIHSCADAIANALIEFLEQDGNGLKKTREAAGKDQLKVISESPSFDETSPVGSMCPECGATLEFKEGCKTCPICGWSKCS